MENKYKTEHDSNNNNNNNDNANILSDIEMYEEFVNLKKRMMEEKNENSQDYVKMKELLKNVCLKYKAIQFGNFMLKSKKTSTYFFSSGQLNNVVALNIISFLLSYSIITKNIHFDYIFGASYKGIPLATMTSHYLFIYMKKCNVFYMYDRKDEKLYGDKGCIVGLQQDISNEHKKKEKEAAEMKSDSEEVTYPKKTILIDDVFTCGTAASEILNKLKQYKDITVVAIFTILNRSEYELNDKNEKIYYKDMFQKKHNIPVYSILTYEDDLYNLCKNA